MAARHIPKIVRVYYKHLAFVGSSYSSLHISLDLTKHTHHLPGPHCLNRGGIRSQCGLLEGIDFNQSPWIRNYDAPLSSRGERLPPHIQQTYTEGDTIEIEVMVTTHHKGHFVFRWALLQQISFQEQCSVAVY